MKTLGLDPARPEDVVDDAGEPLCLVRDYAEEVLAQAELERQVVAPEREGRAVDGRQRRPQLVRHGRDEVALELLDAAFLSHVAKRVDRAGLELDRRHGEPQLPSLDLDRHGLGPRASAVTRGASDGHASAHVRPAADGLVGTAPYDIGGSQTGDRLRSRVPESDDPGRVDEENAVGDELERLGRLGAGLRGPVQPGVLDSEADAAAELFRKREVVVVVAATALGQRERERADRPAAG